MGHILGLWVCCISLMKYHAAVKNVYRCQSEVMKSCVQRFQWESPAGLFFICLQSILFWDLEAELSAEVWFVMQFAQTGRCLFWPPRNEELQARQSVLRSLLTAAVGGRRYAGSSASQLLGVAIGTVALFWQMQFLEAGCVLNILNAYEVKLMIHHFFSLS